MSDLFVPVSVIAGTAIEKAIRQAITLAIRLQTNVEVTHSGIEVFVTDHSNVDDKVAEWQEKRDSSSHRH